MPRTQKRRADQRCKPSQLRAPCFPLLRTGMSSCADDTQCICCGWQSQRYCMHARLHQNASPRGSCEHMSQPGCAAGAGTTLCIFASSVQEGVQLLRWYAATSEPECACAAGIRLWMLCAATRSSCWLARRAVARPRRCPSTSWKTHGVGALILLLQSNTRPPQSFSATICEPSCKQYSL